jgi:hypothetical protein
VWRFVAACVESWAAMSRVLDKAGRPEPDAHRFALDMADWTAGEIRKAADKPNAGLHRTEPAAGSGTVRGLVRPSGVSE